MQQEGTKKSSPVRQRQQEPTTKRAAESSAPTSSDTLTKKKEVTPQEKKGDPDQSKSIPVVQDPGKHTNQERWALDLFSGTGSVRRALEAIGYHVVSVDWDPKWHPDVVADVRKWEYWAQYSPGDFDLVAASPPCTEYSTAMTTRPRRLRQADVVVRKAREIINYFAPAKWWIENPRHGLLRNRPVVRDLAYVDLDYCRFEDLGYQKPTRFWVPDNMARELIHVRCNRQCSSMVWRKGRRPRHRNQLGGRSPYRVSREMAYRIPRGVVEYLCGCTGKQAENEKKSSHVQEVTIKPWHVKPDRPFQVGRMERRGGGCQLMLEVEAGNRCNRAKALIDTGAQKSLV